MLHVHRLWCRAGISSGTVVRPNSVSQEELLELIDKMNRDWRVSGLLVQLPLPGKHSQSSCTRNNISDHVQMSCCRVPLMEVTVNQCRLCWPFTPSEHINERAVCNAIAPEKDVDGFHIVNIGKLCLDQRSMVPATPAAVWEIIKRAGKYFKGTFCSRIVIFFLNDDSHGGLVQSSK